MPRPISKKTMFRGLAAAGVLAVGIAAPAIALADPATPSPDASSSADAKQGRAEHRDRFAEELANELGVPKEKVDAALTKIRQEHRAEKRAERRAEFRAEFREQRQAALKTRLERAVAQGTLTQEQADTILKAFEAGVLPGPGKWHHR